MHWKTSATTVVLNKVADLCVNSVTNVESVDVFTCFFRFSALKLHSEEVNFHYILKLLI
jgi:hypothetical protein